MSEKAEWLIYAYKTFKEYVIETNPRYVDSDFSFENFINWLETTGKYYGT